jgi:hypothetical protein
MWVFADYQPTAFFSLRPYTATSSGGKSLIVPTPFAVRMALLDAAIRTQGLERGKALFPALRELEIAVRLPPRIVVNKTFVKIQRYNDTVLKGGKSAKASRLAQAKADQKWPFQSTIAFREYVQFGGPFTLAVRGMPLETITPLFLQINYLGKRGGFIQLLRRPQAGDALPQDFSVVTETVNGSFPLGILQMLDDWGAKLTFDHVNIYSATPIRAGTHRVFHHVALPYRLARSSKSYTLFERLESG